MGALSRLHRSATLEPRVGAPLAGLEPATCCLGDNCQSSAEPVPAGSSQLRLGRDSAQCGLVGCTTAWWNDHENDRSGPLLPAEAHHGIDPVHRSAPASPARRHCPRRVTGSAPGPPIRRQHGPLRAWPRGRSPVPLSTERSARPGTSSRGWAGCGAARTGPNERSTCGPAPR
jgi:hypothetical protein